MITVLEALADVVQDDYIMRIKAESVVHELVQKGVISAKTGDELLVDMGSRDNID